MKNNPYILLSSLGEQQKPKQQMNIGKIRRRTTFTIHINSCCWYDDEDDEKNNNKILNLSSWKQIETASSSSSFEMCFCCVTVIVIFKMCMRAAIMSARTTHSHTTFILKHLVSSIIYNKVCDRVIYIFQIVEICLYNILAFLSQRLVNPWNFLFSKKKKNKIKSKQQKWKRKKNLTKFSHNTKTTTIQNKFCFFLITSYSLLFLFWVGGVRTSKTSSYLTLFDVTDSPLKKTDDFQEIGYQRFVMLCSFSSLSYILLHFRYFLLVWFFYSFSLLLLLSHSHLCFCIGFFSLSFFHCCITNSNPTV